MTFYLLLLFKEKLWKRNPDSKREHHSPYHDVYAIKLAYKINIVKRMKETCHKSF